MMADEPRESSPLDSLEAKLKAARDRERSGEAEGPNASKANGASMGLGIRVVTELMSALGVGAFIGYWVDQWLASAPWFLVGFLLLGGCAGILNVYRAAAQYDARRRSGSASEGRENDLNSD